MQRISPDLEDNPYEIKDLKQICKEVWRICARYLHSDIFSTFQSKMVSTKSLRSITDIHEELFPVDEPTGYGGQNGIPLLVERNQGSSRLFSLVRKINWASRCQTFKQWIREPLNMVILVWIVCVAMSVSFVLLVTNGVLNGALPVKSQRDAWIEVNNQILNALFTIMCLYQHPKRIHHLVLLHRWQSEDIVRLREVYCKNGTEKPNERKHMLVVVILLHLNCFAQYAICGLTVGYPASRRPAVAITLCIFVAIAAPAIAKSYNKRSPLGKEYGTEKDQEAQTQVTSSYVLLR